MLILSRFPIVEHAFQQFSKGIFDDGEVQRGTLYAKVEVTPGKFAQVFTLHTQCTNFSYPAECIELSRKIRDTSITELADFIASKVESSEKKNEQSSVILAGDFNITRYPTNEHYLAKVFGISPNCIGYLPLIEGEYDDMI